jgi:beta-lactamase class D
MKSKQSILITCFLLAIPNAFAAQDCFILADLQSHKILRQEGNICDVRISPCSTFKIALGLIGYDSHVLKNTKSPTWPYSASYPALFPSWKLPHNPTTWIRNSCIWYSQILTKKLGIEKLKSYLKIINYGNQDFTGDLGKNNGLTTAWLSSSLKISAREQILFLQKALEKKFPFSQHAYAATKQILFVEKLNNGWDLYGKAGSGYQQKTDGLLDMDHQIKWFIGWITKDEHTIIFVKNIMGKNIQGLQIKEQIKEFLQNKNGF